MERPPKTPGPVDTEPPGAPRTFNLERRIRQHVQGPVHGWFAACAPGLEPTLQREAAGLGLEASTAVTGGGVFRGRLADGYRANLHLRVASRVWLRIAGFPARAPEDVYRESRDLPWEALLPPGVPVQVQAGTVHSRVFGSGMLTRPLCDAIARRLRSLGLEPPPWAGHGQGPGDEDPAEDDAGLQRLLARLDSNRLELSLDASGQRLHRRGFRTAHGGAPLRETLAAAILLAAGYDGSVPLVDAMCGSGTFAVEAASIARHLPPGRARPFAFQRWPAYREATYRHLRDRALADVRDVAPCPVIALDRDGVILDVARGHAERAGVLPGVQFGTADFFEAPPPDVPPGLVVLNPPYGLRMPLGDPGPVAFYRTLGGRLATAWRGWRCAVVAPSPAAASALGLQVLERLDVAHGGLRAAVVIARC